MGKFKPFLFGALAGAGVIFFAFQYHVIQTHEGFRFVPRTPQQSLAQSYLDMRTWSGKNFQENPEVTRALVASGLSDLVVGTVADDLLNSVSSDSPMGQLRGFINGSPNDNKSDPLFDAEDFLGIRKDTGNNGNSVKQNPDDLFTTFPFDRDARSGNPSQEVTQAPTTRTSTSVAQRAREAMDAVFNSNSSTPASTAFQEVPDDGFRRNSVPSNGNTTADEMDSLESMLFGKPPVQSAAPATPGPESGTGSSGFGVFEDMTGALEDRADQALERARKGFQNEVTRTLQDSAESAGRFARGKMKESLPESISSMFPDDVSQTVKQVPNSALPDAIQALKDGFDPFIE